MGKYFKVKAGDSYVEWEDGEFKSDNERLLKEIRRRARLISETGVGLTLDGDIYVSGYHEDIEKRWDTAFALV